MTIVLYYLYCVSVASAPFFRRIVTLRDFSESRPTRLRLFAGSAHVSLGSKINGLEMQRDRESLLQVEANEVKDI